MESVAAVSRVNLFYDTGMHGVKGGALSVVGQVIVPFDGLAKVHVFATGTVAAVKIVDLTGINSLASSRTRVDIGPYRR